MARKKFLVSFELPFNESHAFEDMDMGGGGGGGGGCDTDDVKLVRETTFFDGIVSGLLLLLLLVMASLTSPCEIEFEAYKFFMKFVLKSKLLSFSLPPAINSMVSHVADIFGLCSLSMLLIDLSMFDIYDVLFAVVLLVIVGD